MGRKSEGERERRENLLFFFLLIILNTRREECEIGFSCSFFFMNWQQNDKVEEMRIEGKTKRRAERENNKKHKKV